MDHQQIDNPFENPTYTITESPEALKFVESLWEDHQIKEEYRGVKPHLYNDEVMQKLLSYYSKQDQEVMLYIDECKIVKSSFGNFMILNRNIKCLLIDKWWSCYFGKRSDFSQETKDAIEKMFGGFAAWKSARKKEVENVAQGS